MDAVEVGRLLAERHVAVDEPDHVRSLLNYGESPQQGDWTLRSALVRLAQPDPLRVGSVIELTRRLDAAIGHVSKVLTRHAVICDRSLTAEDLAAPPRAPYPDARAADLARLVAAGIDPVGLLAGYEERNPLEHEERVAIPLLAVAVDFEGLAADVAAWADTGPANPPLEAVDRVRDGVAARLDELGVPVETGRRVGTPGEHR